MKNNLIKKNILKKSLVFFIFLILINSFVMIINAEQGWPAFNVCCEKTNAGAWCQNTLEENCQTLVDPLTNSFFRKTPTHCDATSFCKPGCCIDSVEGTCMENTPLKVCEVSSGTWIDDAKCNVPQCNLGCCLIGGEASFVTLTRCKRLSNLYGLETNFKKDIKNEVECSILAYSQDKGACVYEVDGERECIFTSRGTCLGNREDVEFFKDYLCSADELATNCGPTEKTMCVEGKYEVYFQDSCGNPTNIYDADRTYSKDLSYWNKVVPKYESCGKDSGNINSRTCGNYEYLKGSICGEGNAVIGDLICKDLNCYDTINGNDYRNGESWCIYQANVGDGQDSVGSRHFRHICIHGEEVIEPCADFRNEVCIEESFSTEYGNFIESGCRVNRWTDCIDQWTEEDCLNIDKRDCYWHKGFHYGALNETQNIVSKEEAEQLDDEYIGENSGILVGGNICLPDNPPGLKFWEGGEAGTICSLGNSRQVIHFEQGLFGEKECVENCEVLEKKWANKMNQVCKSLGDCGAYVNVVGTYTEKGVLIKQNGNIRLLSGMLNEIEGNSNKGND